MGGRGDSFKFRDYDTDYKQIVSAINRYKIDPKGYDNFVQKHPDMPKFSDDSPAWKILSEFVLDHPENVPEDVDWDDNDIAYAILGAMVLAALFLAP